MKNLRTVTLKESPELIEDLNNIHQIGWPEFIRENPVAVKYWVKLLSWFPEFQFVLLDDEGRSVACGNAIPFYWNGMVEDLPSGWDEVFEKGINDYQNQVKPNAVSAQGIVIHPDFRGQGLSKVMIKEMKNLVKKNHIHRFVAPVRPSQKHHYPLAPMDDYLEWESRGGLPFDPWIRTYYKNGATILGIVEESMVIPAPIKQWEEWTGMRFTKSQKFIIPRGLVQLEVDVNRGIGVYKEPNVWMRLRVD